jgi:DNA gyrase subunit A
VAAARVVRGDEELMMISAGGIVIRTPLDTISERTGRATSGVILMNLREGDRLAAIAIIEPSPNGNGNGDENGASAEDEADEDLVAETDESVLSALPTAEQQQLSREEESSDSDEQDPEEVVDTADDEAAGD